MDRNSFCSYVCIILAVMRGLVRCKESCSMMEFPNISENTVHCKENSIVSIRFHLNKNKCAVIPYNVHIHVIKEENGSHHYECTIHLEAGKCILADTSTACRCPSNDDNMLFLKQVTRNDGGVYVWKWREKGSTAKEKRITLHVSDASREILTQSTDTQETTTTLLQQDTNFESGGVKTDPEEGRDAGKQRHETEESTIGGVRAADPATAAVKSVGPNIDNGVTLIITVAACVCLVVITTVVTAGIVCVVKARSRHDRLQINPDVNVAFANLNGALRELNISRDQARDIYEEIPDPPKAHRTSRVGSTSSSKSGVKLPPIPDMEQHEATATHSPLKEAESCDCFDGYLHPADICVQLPTNTN